MTCKIYLLRNKVNGKIYIGQTWLEFENRMGKHGEKYKNSPYVHNAIQKYGVENFVYEILATCEDQEIADKLEAKYIEQYNSQNHDIGYNIKNGGMGGKHSDESKAKISETLKKNGIPQASMDAILKAGYAWKGVKRGEHTEERKQQQSEISTEWHANNDHPMLGKHHAEETKEKLSEATKKLWDDEDYRNNMITKHQENIAVWQMPKTKEAAIISLYQSGMPFKQMCETLKTNNSSIYRVLKRNNIPLDKNRNK
jgi:group I intron endonuclease